MQDDLLTGEDVPVMRLWKCPRCERTQWDEVRPECHGVRMVPEGG
jgi:hypothetical protein